MRIKTRKFLSVLLGAALMFTCMPAAYAEETAVNTDVMVTTDDNIGNITKTDEGGDNGQEIQTITGFINLEDDSANDIEVMQGTPESEIPFPVSITANLDSGGQTGIPVGEWEIADGSYEPDIPGFYVFKPVRESLSLPECLILPEDISLPRVNVEVAGLENTAELFENKNLPPDGDIVQDGNENEELQYKTIASFVIPEDDAVTDMSGQPEITVALGTPESEIPFPVSITANLDDSSQLEIPVGEWENVAGAFDPYTERPYMFAPVRESLILPEGVTLKDDIELPRLRVVVGEVIAEAATLAAVAAPNETSTWYIGDTYDSGSGSYGGGTWEWDADNKILKLNNFNFTSDQNPALSLTSAVTIEITGENSIVSTHTSVGGSVIYTENDITIDGEGTLDVKFDSTTFGCSGISMWGGDLAINGGKVTVSGNATTMFTAVYLFDSLTVSGTGTLIAISSEDDMSAVRAGSAPAAAKGSVNAGGSPLVDVTWSDDDGCYLTEVNGAEVKVPYVMLEGGGGDNPEPAGYTLYFDGTDLKKGTWNGSSLESGTNVANDASWSIESNTLKLNGFVFDTSAAVALVTAADTTISLANGSTNSFTSTATGIQSINSAGLYALGSLTITGDGLLTLQGGNGVSRDSYGYQGKSGGSLAVTGNTELVALGGSTTSTSYGVYTTGAGTAITVDGGSITAKGSESGSTSVGLRAVTTLEVKNGGVIEAHGATQAIEKAAASAPVGIESVKGATTYNGDAEEEVEWLNNVAGANSYTYKVTNSTVAKHVTINKSGGDNIKPTVLTVTPDGTDEAVSGSVVITFSEAMDTTVLGVVKLGTTTLTGGTWSSGTTYTIPYNGLENNTSYTVDISGFEDAAGNAMVQDASNSFTTIASGTAKTLSSIAITTPPTKTTYTAGESFNRTGMTVTATYSDGTTAEVTGYTITPSGALTAGTTSVTIRYTEDGVTKMITLPITVNPDSKNDGGRPSYTPPPVIIGKPPVITEPQIKNHIENNIMKVPYSMTNGTVNSEVSASLLDNIIKNAFTDDENGKKIIKLDYNGVFDPDNMEKLTLTLNASRLKPEDGEVIAFIIETPYGAFIFTTEQMKLWSGGISGEYIITLQKSNQSFSLSIKKDGKSITSGKTEPIGRIGIFYGFVEDDYTGNIAVTDRNNKILPTSEYENGMVYADIYSSGTYKAVYIENGFEREEGTDYAEGWSNPNSDLEKRVYYSKNGVPLTGLYTINGEKYYFKKDGTMHTGWLSTVSGTKYYFNRYGIIASGKWVRINGKIYYFKPDGKLAVNEIIDGYTVDENGVRADKKNEESDED